MTKQTILGKKAPKDDVVAAPPKAPKELKSLTKAPQKVTRENRSLKDLMATDAASKLANRALETPLAVKEEVSQEEPFSIQPTVVTLSTEFPSKKPAVKETASSLNTLETLRSLLNVTPPNPAVTTTPIEGFRTLLMTPATPRAQDAFDERLRQLIKK